MKKVAFFICLLSSLFTYSQEKRLALVIGNSEYKHGGVLRNPVNDAYAMRQVLTRVGFEVLEFYNLDYREMKRAVDDFGLKLKEYEIGLFFYAGHGIQARGNNYLIPVDANLLSENDVEYDCIDAGRVLGKMEDAENSTNIIILDACRNNPFERSWTRSSQGRGLASMDAPVGSILAYATAPGSTASDGTGQNGLYTSALIEFISEPGLSIEDVFKQVRISVLNKSDGNQTPWESTSLVGSFYFLQDISESKADAYVSETITPEEEVRETAKTPSRDDRPAEGNIDLLAGWKMKSEVMVGFGNSFLNQEHLLQFRVAYVYRRFGLFAESGFDFRLQPRKVLVSINDNVVDQYREYRWIWPLGVGKNFVLSTNEKGFETGAYLGIYGLISFPGRLGFEENQTEFDISASGGLYLKAKWAGLKSGIDWYRFGYVDEGSLKINITLYIRI